MRGKWFDPGAPRSAPGPRVALRGAGSPIIRAQLPLTTAQQENQVQASRGLRRSLLHYRSAPTGSGLTPSGAPSPEERPSFRRSGGNTTGWLQHKATSGGKRFLYTTVSATGRRCEGCEGCEG